MNTPNLLRTAGVFLLTAFLLFQTSTVVTASELTYQPINPSFGGSSLNGSVLLNQANAQNTFKEEEDLLADFEDQLTRRILSSLAWKITDSAFGEEDISSGTYSIGNIDIEVTEDADGVGVNITDYSTGGTTTITIPYY